MIQQGSHSIQSKLELTSLLNPLQLESNNTETTPNSYPFPVGRDAAKPILSSSPNPLPCDRTMSRIRQNQKRAVYILTQEEAYDRLGIAPVTAYPERLKAKQLSPRDHLPDEKRREMNYLVSFGQFFEGVSKPPAPVYYERPVLCVRLEMLPISRYLERLRRKAIGQCHVW